MLRALVVDDSKLIRNMVCTQLHRLEIASDQADNGREALQLFGLQQYDILILDVVMPEMDGIDLTRRIREQNQDVPILILTSAAHPRYQKDAIEAGANRYLIKPLDNELFQVALHDLLPELDGSSAC